MADKEKIILETEVKAVLTGVKDVASKIQDFRKQMDTVEIPKDIGKNLEKTFEKILKNVGEFDVLVNKGVNSMADTREIERAWKGILRDLNSIEATFNGLDSSKIFPKAVTENITKAQAALVKYLDKLEETKKTSSYKTKVDARDKAAIEEQAKHKALTQAIQAKAKAELDYNNKSQQWTKDKQKEYDDEIKEIKRLKKEKEDYLEKTKKKEKEQLAEQLRMEGYLSGDAKKGYRVSGRKITSVNAIKDTAEKEAAQERLRLAQETLQELQTIKNAEADFDTPIRSHEETVKGLEKIKAEVIETKKAFDEATAEVTSYETQLAQAKQETAKLDAELEAMSMDEAKQEWQVLIDLIREFTGIDLSQSAQDIELVKRALENYKTDQVQKLPEIFELLKRRMGEVPLAAGAVTNSVIGVAEGTKEMARAEQEVENLKNQLLDFFSLTNSVELFKRAISSAVNTVKELDKVMTETAVVTDYSIGDMWDRLPQYATQASKLGSSISDLYSATTLYYQQGLKTEQAMGVGIETMKMARIAGMDATDATTAMTAALRGFNMAVDEMNAQKVNDVYSELAAITAADTNQIATAMGKTASIAASANMEFETTAAFLAQIIETTQEAPETAGTALKTIIARFTEVKELFSEGMLTGEDAEGEEININKIDEALGTIGISLKDFLNGTKGIDDIFLELASKWDDLDLSTQRYIATTAAGSRQQSRFIAMMSNYQRTIELVNAANNSAGASQEQYSKTLESLDTKLQQLKNAWDTFAMGLANNETIKDVVDLLTFLLETINNIIDVISGENGAIKSIASLGFAFGSLKIGGSVFEAIFESVKQVASKEGKESGIVFGDVFSKTFSEKMSKTGSFVKKFFPNKKGREELLGITDLEKAIKTIDFSELTEASREKLGKDILASFDDITKEIPSLEASNLADAKESFNNLFSDKPAEAIKRLNIELEGTGKKLVVTKEMAKDATSTLEQGFGKAAAAAAGTALILNRVTTDLRNTGHERGAEGFEELTNGATFLAGALAVLPGLLKAVGLATKATPIGWAITAVTAVFSVGKAVSAWIETGAEKLERLNKEAQEAADAANEAKEAYQSLLSSESEYSELQKEFEGLIKGTDEWRRKLVEANQQVLELLNTYPQLAQYIGRGAEGQLIIEDKGWDDLAKQMEEQAINTQTMSAMANINVTGEEQEQKQVDIFYKMRDGKKYYDKEAEQLILNNLEKILSAQKTAVNKRMVEEGRLTETEKENLWNGITELRNLEYSEAILIDYLENHGFVNLYNKDFVELAKNAGVVADELYYSSQKISEYNSYMEKEGLIAESNLAAFLGSSEAASVSKYGDQIAQGIARQNIWDIDDKIENKAKSLEKNPYLTKKYEEATGRDSEGMSKEDMTNALAKIEIGKELSGQVDKIINYLDSMSDQEQAERFAAIMSGEVKNFTATEAENLESAIDWESFAKAQGYNSFQALATANGKSEDDYKTYLLEPFKDLSEKMAALFRGDISWAGGKTHLANSTYGEQQAYANFASQALGVLGQKGAESVVDVVDKLLADEKTRDQVFNLLNTTNFKKEGAAEELIADLERIGVDMSNIEIDSFVKDLNKLGESFRKFDLKSLMDQSKKLLDLSDDLKTREAEEGLTDEERTTLLTMPGIKEEDFAWTGQEWIYLDDSMAGLSRALRENTEAILEQKTIGLEEQIATGEKLEKIFGDDNSVDIMKWSNRGQKITDSLSLEEFLKGREGVLTAADIRSIFGEEAGKTDTEAWAIFDKYKFAYDNLVGNKNTYDLYSQNMGTAAMLSGYLGQGKGTTEDYKTATEAREKILGTEQLAKTLEGLFDSGAKDVDGFDVAIRALAADLGLSQRNMKKFVDTLGDVKDSLTASKRGTEEYSSAWQKVQDSLKDVFGAKAFEGIDISQELMEKLVAGSEDAFAEVEKIIHDNTLREIGTLAKDTKGIWDNLQNELPNLQANITTDYNATELNNIFGEIITQANKAGEEARAKLAEKLLTLGFQLNWSEVGDNITGAVVTKINRGDLFRNYVSSSGGGGSISNWENPYDKMYNVVQRINAELRIRERLERQYQRLLENSVNSSSELAKNAREQIASLEYEKKTREYLLEKRREEMALLGSEFSDVAHYASWDENVGVMLNQEALAKLDGSTNEKLTSKVEKYISKMEEKADQIYEEANAIDEIKDTVEEIRNQGKDEYLNFENQVKDALIFEREQEIEKLTEINETINEANSRLISSMRDTINQQRQDRQNVETEEELNEKRARLAYLQMDTSGANDLEILELQEEIRKQEQDYTDSLIDQKIQQLEDQNNEAYEQRERQIEILQWQKDFWEKNGDIWKDVQEIVRGGFDPETGIINGSKLKEILQNEANFKGLSAIGQQEWWKDLTETLTAAFGYLEVNQQLEDIGATAGEKIKFKYGSKELSGIINEDGSVTTDDGRVFNNVYKGFGGYYAGENIKEEQKQVIEEPSFKTEKAENAGSNGYYDNQGYDRQEIENIQKKLSALGYEVGEIDGLYGERTKKAVIDFKKSRNMPETSAQLTDYFLEKLSQAYKYSLIPPVKGAGGRIGVVQHAFKTGGLADFTGPAWLDGTKAKPEYVLNAAQTERFFTLVDILGSWKDLNNNKNIQNSGDNIVDIDINIETVKEEADVDMLAEKVQRAIVTSAQYRNNTFIQR